MICTAHSFVLNFLFQWYRVYPCALAQINTICIYIHIYNSTVYYEYSDSFILGHITKFEVKTFTSGILEVSKNAFLQNFKAAEQKLFHRFKDDRVFYVFKDRFFDVCPRTICSHFKLLEKNTVGSAYNDLQGT